MSCLGEQRCEMADNSPSAALQRLKAVDALPDMCLLFAYR